MGDWDGDGVTEIGLSQESGGFFDRCNTLTTGVADDEFFFGDPDDRFVVGDWGVIDGRDSPAVFRARTRRSSSNTTWSPASPTLGSTSARPPWLPVAGKIALG